MQEVPHKWMRMSCGIHATKIPFSMRRLSLYFLSLTLLSTLSAQSVRVPAVIPELLDDTAWGLSVRDVTTGLQVVDLQASHLLTPASTMKIISTAAAYRILGPDYRIPTEVMMTGPVRDGVLEGDLCLVGHGDPTIESKYLPRDERWALYDEISAALSERGITRISGSVLALSDRRDFQAVNPYWSAVDMGNYYGAGHFMLNVLDNTYYLSFRNYGRDFSVTPEVPGLRLVGLYARTSRVTSDSLYVSSFPLSDGSLAITGAYPSRAKSLGIRGAVPDPPLLLAKRVRDRLQRDGITVEGGYRTVAQLPRGSVLLMTHYSPQLSEVIRLTNHHSINMYAEGCLRLIADRVPALPGETVTETAIRAVRDHWASQGIPGALLEMYDGSGLTRANKVAPAYMTDLLTRVWRETDGVGFPQLLPAIGQEGTLRLLLAGTRLEGAGRMKSGSIHGVTCYAGYITHGGRTYAVSVMVNNHTRRHSEVRRAIGDLLLSTFVL